MKTIYHAADFDGLCSGAIVKHFNPDTEMIPLNYGDDCPICSDGEEVVICDFSFPKAIMQDLSERCKLTWIDHHITALNECCDIKSKGKRNIKKAACELTWEYATDAPMPRAVRLLGRYDVWDHENPDVIFFQYGMRSFKGTDPRTSQIVWEKLFSNNNGFINQLIDRGMAVFDYQHELDKRTLANGFETTLLGHKCLAVNAVCSPYLFNDIDQDVGLSFVMTSSREYIVSLRSSKVDVAEIAKTFGGGGHAGAAGFKCMELPF